MKPRNHNKIYALPKNQQKDFFKAIENERSFHPMNRLDNGYVLNQETKVYLDQEREDKKYCFLDVTCVDGNSVIHTSKLLEKLAKTHEFDLVQAARITVGAQNVGRNSK